MRYTSSITRAPKEGGVQRWREWVTAALNSQLMHGISWDDVYPSAVSVGGGANVPSFTAYTGNLLAYEFNGTGPTTKELQIEFQLPHSRKDNSNIVPHIHLYIPDDATGGTIEFGLEYEWSDVNDTGAITTSTVYGTVVRTASQGIARNQILSFGELDGDGKGLSSIVSCRLFRNPADATDTFEESVWLKSADIHVQKTWLGSYKEFLRS